MATNSTTAAPTSAHVAIKCPFLTQSGYSDTTDEYYCDYTPWAYGIFALIGLLLIVVPLLLLICCCIRRQNRKHWKRIRRLTSTDSNSSSHGSRNLPYEPLRQDDKEAAGHTYGSVDHSDRVDSPTCPSPSNDGPTENSLRTHDSTSIASSKASLFPNYDETSLNFRNDGIASRPRIPTPNSLQRSPDPHANSNSSDMNKNSTDANPYLVTGIVADSSTAYRNITSPKGKSNSAIYPALPEGSPNVAFKPDNKLNNGYGKAKPKPEVPLYEDVEAPKEKRPLQESPIYNVLENPDDDAEQRDSSPLLTKDEPQLHEDPTYNVLEGPEDNVPNDRSPGDPIYNVLEGPQADDEQVKTFHDSVKKEPLPGTTEESQNNGNQRQESLIDFDQTESLQEQCPPEQQDTLDVHPDPVYETLEPPLPEIPGNSKQSSGTEQSPEGKAALLDYAEVPVSGDDIETRLAAEDSHEDGQAERESPGLYMPLIPPKAGAKRQPTLESLTDSTENDKQLLEEPRKRFTSRADYEEFLLDVVRSLPANERNGCYVVRESVTAPGSKVLTMYNRQPDSEKELYNFKVNFTEDNQAYLAKSKRKFSSLQDLMEFLKENKDMLPCPLRDSILQEAS